MIHLFPIINHEYGFHTPDSVTGDLLVEKTVPGFDSDWAAMQDFNDTARNHCGATTITNITLQLLQRMPVRAMQGQKVPDLFASVHHFVPNGPIFNLEKYANRFFENAVLPLRCVTTLRRKKSPEDLNRLLEQVHHEIHAGRPCALLVSSAMFGWHWILCFGYRQYKSGTEYLLIEDNWHRRGLQLYCPDEVSTLQRVVTFKGMPTDTL